MSRALAKVAPLSAEERADLKSCIRQIDSAVLELEQAALAFREIRDNRLYREEAATFEEFCRRRWQFGRQHVNRLITFAETTRVLVSADTKTPAPTAEGQTRPLAALPAAEQPVAWARAVEAAGGAVPTGAQVAAVVREMRAPSSAPVEIVAEAAASAPSASPRETMPELDHAGPILALIGRLSLSDPAQLAALRAVGTHIQRLLTDSASQP